METDDPNLYGFRLLRERLNLPHVGQRVRHRVRQTMWKVMKEKELWIESRPRNGGPAEMVPAIYLRFWKPREDQGPGQGKTLSHQYTPTDHSFANYWEILDQ